MKHILLFIIFFVLLQIVSAQQHKTESLSDALLGFNQIQDSTRTKTWWFHGETETTKEGITADLEAFKKAGKDKKNPFTGKTVPYDQEIARMEREMATLKSRIYN